MFIRTTSSLATAAVMTATLYYGMHLLIDAGGVPVFTKAPPKIEWTIYEPKPDPKPEARKKPELKEVVPQPEIDFTPPTITTPGPLVNTKQIPLPQNDGKPIFSKPDRDAQPIYRQEPAFSNITETAFLTLEFDVRPDGSVAKDSIRVVQSTSSRLERPAVRAVGKWKYQAKVYNGEPVWQRGVRVRFTVEPPR